MRVVLTSGIMLGLEAVSAIPGRDDRVFPVTTTKVPKQQAKCLAALVQFWPSAPTIWNTSQKSLLFPFAHLPVSRRDKLLPYD